MRDCSGERQVAMPAHISGGYARPFSLPRGVLLPKKSFHPRSFDCTRALLARVRFRASALLSRCNLRVRSRLELSVFARCHPPLSAIPAPCGSERPDKEKGQSGGTLCPDFGRPGDCRGHFGASPQAALASRRGEGGGEGALASLHRRPISSCAAGLWIQPRPCKQSGSNLSSKATPRQLANLPERASSRARACTRCKVSLKSRLSRVMRGSLARSRGLPRAP